MAFSTVSTAKVMQCRFDAFRRRLRFVRIRHVRQSGTAHVVKEFGWLGLGQGHILGSWPKFAWQMTKKTGLNPRQEKAIRYLIKNNKITVNEYQKITSYIRKTAQRDLEELSTKAIIKGVAKSSTDPTKHYILL